jgi:hypothetical protein
MPPLSLVPPPAEPRSPLQATAVAAFAIFTLGTIFYALGVTAWSGRHVATLEVRQGTAGPVHLEPSMSPVRVFAHFDRRPAKPCRVALRGPDGRTLWTENRDPGTWAVGQARSRNAGTTLVIETFAVPRSGDYTLGVDLGAGGRDVVRGVRLEVRSRVATVQAWFVYTGAFLSLASLATLLVTSAGARRSGDRRARAA